LATGSRGYKNQVRLRGLMKNLPRQVLFVCSLSLSGFNRPIPLKIAPMGDRTPLALRLCKAANGVSKINGEVCRQMWSGLYPERAIICNLERPVQIVFAGKAHPADEKSKQIMKRLIEWSHHPDLKNRIVFIEDYDMHIAEKLVQGVDVWLNNPIRPQEASGTSGQKASFNGVINCSILDGWWPEAYQTTVDDKGLNGWAIGDGTQVDDPQLQNQLDAESLYQLLEKEIIPCYYDRDEAGLPHRWIAMMKASIKTVAPFFNSDRMVKEYVQKVYLQPVKAPEPMTVR